MSDKEKNDYQASASAEASIGSIENHNQGVVRKFFTDWKPVSVVEIDPTLSRVDRAIKGVSNLPLKKSLSSRHIQMIAFGGSIGAGLFIGTGNTLKYAGPAGVVIGYLITGALLFFTMNALGELGARYPATGAFSAYTSRFIHLSWGFAVGWNYAIGWLLSLPTELIAAAVTISYWESPAAEVNKAAWVALFYGCIVLINVFGVRGYGEAEFFFSLIKILTILGFIILGIILTCGGGPTHEYIGGRYWHDPGSFANGAKGVFKVFATAAYAFSGIEFAGLSAMETKNPHLVLPRATKQVFWRIIIFYVVSIILVGCLVPYSHHRLGTAKNASASPFVIAIEQARIKALPSIINVVICLSVFSVGNAAVFGASRTLVALAAQGHAPKQLMYIDRQGRPVVAIIINLVFGLLGFVSATPNYSQGFTWLSTLGGLSGQLVWGSVMFAHLRHRWALKANNVGIDTLDWASPTGEWGSWVGLVLTLFILVVQFWVGLFPLGSHGRADAKSFFQIWISACIILTLFIGHFLWFRDPYIKTKDLNIHDGLRFSDPQQIKADIEERKAALALRPWYVRAYYFWC